MRIGVKRLAIDFDGVLCDRYGIPRSVDWFDCPPTVNAVDAIKYLDKSYDLYVCTNRRRKEWPKIKEWLKDWGFPDLKVTNKKLIGTIAYVDDRAIRFTNWLDITKYFK
ncbi:hypothetical protein KJ836_02785 [Patescibacteria group bacterium]|nr:hypothetical protein [Patescibacteria group bacterium]